MENISEENLGTSKLEAQEGLLREKVDKECRERMGKQRHIYHKHFEKMEHLFIKTIR